MSDTSRDIIRYISAVASEDPVDEYYVLGVCKAYLSMRCVNEYACIRKEVCSL